jgi:hypothetical protein
LKLWKIYQTVNNDWDTFQAAVVAAPTEDIARTIHPGGEFWEERVWCAPQDVQVVYLGTAKEGTEQGIILSYFKAG